MNLMTEVLAVSEVVGVSTNIPTLRAALNHPDFAAGKYTTGLIESLPR